MCILLGQTFGYLSFFIIESNKELSKQTIVNTTSLKKPIEPLRVPPVKPEVKPSVPKTTTYSYHSHALNNSAWQKYIHHYRIPGNETKGVFLFVVNFHFHAYEKIDFILNKYFVEFRKRYIMDFDVVILGPGGDRQRGVISNGLPELGFYSYHTLTITYEQLCMKEKCFYKGFFLINDDSYIDPRFLSSYNLSQSWTEPTVIVNHKDPWHWSHRNLHGKTYTVSYENAVKELLQTKDGKQCRLNNRHNWRRGYSDAFYIVKEDMPKWHRMMLVMKKHYVFLELAIPTVNWCLTKNEFIDCNHGKMLDRYTCVHMHPVKYRQPNMMEFSLLRMDHLNMNDTPPRRY